MSLQGARTPEHANSGSWAGTILAPALWERAGARLRDWGKNHRSRHFDNTFTNFFFLIVFALNAHSTSQMPENHCTSPCPQRHATRSTSTCTRADLYPTGHILRPHNPSPLPVRAALSWGSPQHTQHRLKSEGAGPGFRWRIKRETLTSGITKEMFTWLVSRCLGGCSVARALTVPCPVLIRP